jgi:hypothetical protein
MRPTWRPCPGSGRGRQLRPKSGANLPGRFGVSVIPVARAAAMTASASPGQGTLGDVLAELNPGQTVTVIVTCPDTVKQTVQVSLGHYPG